MKAERVRSLVCFWRPSQAEISGTGGDLDIGGDLDTGGDLEAGMEICRAHSWIADIFLGFSLFLPQIER